MYSSRLAVEQAQWIQLLLQQLQPSLHTNIGLLCRLKITGIRMCTTLVLRGPAVERIFRHCMAKHNVVPKVAVGGLIVEIVNLV